MALHVKSAVYDDVKEQKKLKNWLEWIWRQNNPNIVLVVAITASVNMQGHL